MIRAAAAAALVFAAATPAAAADRYPAAVASGSPRAIVEPDAGLQLTGVQVFLAAGLERQSSANAGIAALTAECILATPVTIKGTSLALQDALDRIPASITYAVDTRTVHFYVESAPARLGDALGLLAQAFAHPDFSAKTIATARRSMDVRSGEAQSSPFFVGAQMARRGYYLAGAGTEAFGSPSTLDAITPADVRAYFDQFYRRDGLSASAAGESAPALPAALGAIANALPAGTSPEPDRRVATISSNVKRIVTHRDVGAPLTVLAFAAPPPSSADFGAMLLAQALLSSIFDPSDGTTLEPIQRSVQAFYQYDALPSSFMLVINGARIDRTAGIGEALLVTKSLSKTKLDAKALARTKARAAGELLESTLSLADRSYMLGALAGQGVAPDALNAALEAIDRTTAADLQRVAGQYFQKFIVAEVIPRDQPGG